MEQKLAVFISIPKCASKTILEMYELGLNRNIDGDDKNHFVIYENHQRLKILEEKYDLNKKFIFTFVRNPYDRIRSWFYYHQFLPLYKNTTLNEWINDGCKTHWGEQNATDWTKENKSPLLQYNFIEGKTKMDYIGKIENFEKDCKNIIEKLNFIFKENNVPKNIKYNYIVKNASSVYKEEITVENKEKIYNMFKKDFEYFGYTK